MDCFVNKKHGFEAIQLYKEGPKKAKYWSKKIQMEGSESYT